MAGSYGHTQHGFSMLENLKDCGEAIHELLYLVESTMTPVQARRILKTRYYPMARGEKPKDKAFLKIDKLREK